MPKIGASTTLTIDKPAIVRPCGGRRSAHGALGLENPTTAVLMPASRIGAGVLHHAAAPQAPAVIPASATSTKGGELPPQQLREGQWSRLGLMRMDACFCAAVRRAPECPTCEEEAA